MKPAEPQPGDTIKQRARGPQNKIVGGRAGGFRHGSVDAQRQSPGRLERQPVATAGEGDDAVEIMPAVLAAAQNVQRQVDFGGRAPKASAPGR
jgi:hypothetical protein